MEAANEIAKAQETLGKQLKNLFSNYKKDPHDRKTEQYFIKKSTEIEYLWETIKENHKKFLKLDFPTHTYFKEDYYQQLYELYYDITRNITESKQKFVSKPIQGEATTNRLKEEEVRINQIIQTIADISQELCKNEPRSRYQFLLEKLSKQWDVISEIYIELQVQDLDHMIKGTIQNLERQYEKVVQDLQDKIQEGQQGSKQSNITLPQIKLPHFDGQYEEWVTFRDIFVKVIHENVTIAKIEKMQYLKTHVKGEAGRLIQHLSIAENNYETAWNILNDRYSNERRIVSKLLDKILDLPIIYQESSVKIKQLHDTVVECLEAINNLKVDTSSWGPIISRIICRKWDQETNRLYEQSLSNPHELQDFAEMKKFLQARFQSLETITDAQKKTRHNSNYNDNFRKKFVCKHCNDNHMIYQCPKFKTLSPELRLKTAKEKHLCLKCLGHEFGVKCSFTRKCNICDGNHHTLVHVGSFVQQQPKGTGFRNGQKTETNNVQKTETKSHVSRKNEMVFLATALIRVRSNYGNYENLRVLIDPGSQSTFITEEAASLLALPRQKIQAKVSGLGAGEPQVSKSQVHMLIKPRFSSDFQLDATGIILPNITQSLPEAELKIDISQWQNDMLADPIFYRPGPVDILLGAREYAKLILQGIRKTEDGLLGQQTELGWILSGNLPKNLSNMPQVLSMVTCIEEDKQLTKFWEVEEVSTTRPLSKDDQYCEQHYTENTVRNTDGTYTVRIPFNGKESLLGASKPRAAARLLQLEKKLSSDDELEQNYKQFMQEYQNLGHMKLVPHTELQHQYIIPHQPVIKESSTTTKLRVVFDGSSKTSTGLSLNDTMYAGPRLQPELSEILLRWRSHKVVITADIEKMYRQIKIHADDWKYQKILWRFNNTDPISEYCLTTVTYGMTAAPYLAIKTLQRLAQDEKCNYPNASKAAMTDFYVDDLLSGADTMEEALKLQNELIEMFKQGGFKLRRWSSNKPELIQKLPDGLADHSALEITEDDVRKSLGIHWAPYNDTFKFKTEISTNDNITKRSILSEVAKLFDPLGWLAPVIVQAKLLIQELWLQELKWDEPVPTAIENKWKSFRSELKEVEKITIPRWTYQNKSSHVELHGFCDASEKAYGAVLYLKINNSLDETKIVLLTAKSKIAPARMKVTLPRLELCSAVLLSQLMQKTATCLSLQDAPVYAWTDSTIALSWIKGDPSRWKNFVANRVAEINKLVPNQHWHHVRTNDNPADVISRGISPNLLQNHTMWWVGPSWLKSITEIPTNHIPVTTEEVRSCHHVVLTTQNDKTKNELIERFSSFTHMIRVISYCKRFIQKCRRQPNQNLLLTVEELDKTLTHLVKLDQLQYFKSEIQKLKKGCQLDNNSKILNLNPWLDDNEILRVGGRLQNSLLPHDNKHPMIISNASHLTKLVILHAHASTLHGGIKLTLSYTRNRFWIVNGKRQVKTIINHCVRCLRFKAQTVDQQMGNLPAPRITPSHPFLHSGVDYAGPVQVKTTKGRGYKSYKGYITIFVCLATKAIHIEVVSDMSADTFLAAFRRFISRRGRCAHLYSDNGTNFIGASKILHDEVIKTVQKPEIQDTLVTGGTQWHFIPPASPHFGGLWEAGVKSMKFHLKRIIGDTPLTYEELTTLTHQIEACLNSRPLCPLSNDPDDLAALTPGHFLIGREIISLPDPVTTNINSDIVGRWKLVQKIKKDFWKCWSNDYLHQLQQRYKWKKQQDPLNVGDLVLVKDQNINPSKWPLARIAEVHPGKDTTVRVVTIKRAEGGPVKRSTHKLIPILSNTEPEERLVHKKTRSSRQHWKKILIAVLFLVTIQGSKASQYSIHYPQPGLYIEHIGHARIDRGMFRIDLKYDKNKIKNDSINVQDAVKQIDDLCQQVRSIDTTTQCVALIHHLKEKEKQCQWIQNGLQMVISKREKRGVLGKFLTSIFGVNDEVYTDIEDLNKNQRELIKASNHQTKFMVHALSTFNDTESRIDSQLKRFREKINEGIALMSDMKKWYRAVDANKLAIHFLSCYQVVFNYIEEILDYHKRLLDVHYHKDHFYELISPTHIEELIASASKKIPPSIEIISYPVLRTKIEHTEDSIHVYGYFVMVEHNEFMLIKSTPIPIKKEAGSCWILNIPNEALAIDYDSQLYFPISEDELSTSLKMAENVFVVSPITTRGIDTSPNCIIDQIYQREENTSCQVLEHPMTSIVWKELHTTNAWLAIIPEKTKIAIYCDGTRDDVTLNQTAIIKIAPNCVIKTKKNTLVPKRSKTITVLEAFSKPILQNISLFPVGQEKETPLVDEPVINVSNNINKLMGEETNIKQQLEEIHWRTIKHHVLATTLSGTAVTIIIIIIFIMVFTRYKQRQSHKSTKEGDREASNTLLSTIRTDQPPPEAFILEPLNTQASSNRDTSTS